MQASPELVATVLAKYYLAEKRTVVRPQVTKTVEEQVTVKVPTTRQIEHKAKLAGWVIPSAIGILVAGLAAGFFTGNHIFSLVGYAERYGCSRMLDNYSKWWSNIGSVMDIASRHLTRLIFLIAGVLVGASALPLGAFATKRNLGNGPRATCQGKGETISTGYPGESSSVCQSSQISWNLRQPAKRLRTCRLADHAMRAYHFVPWARSEMGRIFSLPIAVAASRFSPTSTRRAHRAKNFLCFR